VVKKPRRFVTGKWTELLGDNIRFSLQILKKHALFCKLPCSCVYRWVRDLAISPHALVTLGRGFWQCAKAWQ
jgi:hypothetical protein